MAKVAKQEKRQYETCFKNIHYWTYLMDNQVRIVTADLKDHVTTEVMDNNQQAFEAFHALNLDLALSDMSLATIITLRCRQPRGAERCSDKEWSAVVQVWEYQRLHPKR